MDDLKDDKRHISLSAADFKLLNPNTQTCPIFRSRRDANLTKYIYKRVPVLINKTRKQGGNPWGIKFVRMFDHDAAAELFEQGESLAKTHLKLNGNIFSSGKRRYLPLYEAKMVQMYDHRAATVVRDETNWARQGQTIDTTLTEHQNPEFSPLPRWWISAENIIRVMEGKQQPAYLAYKDVTSATNQRTMIAAFVPYTATLHPIPVIITEYAKFPRRECCLLANLNSFVYDFVARQKVGGLHLSFFIVDQIPTFPPDFYAQKCPWHKKQTLKKWISDRVLKLTCTSSDMVPLAKAAGLKPPIHKWDPAERLDLMAELDAAFFLLYDIERNDVEYILSTFAGVRKDRESILDASSTFDLILKHYDSLREKLK
jgi:hypothetical protein